jgi:cation diffusion facilitator family transporter
MVNVKSKTALLSVLSNTILIVMKVSAGILSGSVSILSEAIHSAMDLVASFIAVFSVTVSSKPPDKEHPYGHGKMKIFPDSRRSFILSPPGSLSRAVRS